jgi:hypothetical protein
MYPHVKQFETHKRLHDQASQLANELDLARRPRVGRSPSKRKHFIRTAWFSVIVRRRRRPA